MTNDGVWGKRLYVVACHRSIFVFCLAVQWQASRVCERPFFGFRLIREIEAYTERKRLIAWPSPVDFRLSFPCDPFSFAAAWQPHGVYLAVSFSFAHFAAGQPHGIRFIQF